MKMNINIVDTGQDTFPRVGWESWNSYNSAIQEKITLKTLKSITTC